jgi:hypothetical protein
MQHAKLKHSFIGTFRYFINLNEKTTTWDDPRNDPRNKYKPIQIPMQVKPVKIPDRPCLLTVETIQAYAWISEKINPNLSNSKLSSPSISKLPRAIGFHQCESNSLK